MTSSIYVTRKIPDMGLKMLRDKGYAVDVNPEDTLLTQEQLIKALKSKSYDVVLTLLTDKIDAAVFDAAPSVKLYVNYASGFDNLDLVEAKKRGIQIANAPAELTCEAVAEHTIALMLALAARIVEADDYMRQGKYTGWEPMNFIGTDILGKTLGLVGAGRIGARVAHYAKALGMTVLYYDVKRSEALDTDGATYVATLDELLPKADVVSLHVPLLDSTHHLMNDARFRQMKRTAFLINTSRGPVIDESALEVALREKIIAAAALDVFEFEPQVTPGLIPLQNIILTPHIASASDATRDQMAEIAAENIIDFFDGKTPRNLVNP